MTDLDALENDLQIGGQEYRCGRCRDWTTCVDTIAGAITSPEYPCPDCCPTEYRIWWWAQVATPGQLLLVGPSGLRCRVVLPSQVGMDGGDAAVQPCQSVQGVACRERVLVRSEDHGAVSWVDAADVRIAVETSQGAVGIHSSA